MKRVADEKVLVLDFGSQYAQLIARRVRQQHVYCEIVRHNITAQRIRELAPKGIILSGGPASVYEPGAPQVRPGNLPPRRARAGHLLRAAPGLPGPRRAGRGARRPRVRPGQLPRRRAGRAVRRRSPADRRLDEPRRPGVGSFGRFPAAGGHGHLPGGGGETPPAADLRLAVPPRGHPHARGREDPGQLPPDGLRLHGDVASWAISPAKRSRRSAAAWATAG